MGARPPPGTGYTGPAVRIETLFVHGRILTMDPARPQVEALAVAGGRVLATGATAALLARRERDTAVIDLGGRFACPAFIDPHTHFSMTALAPAEADCRTPPLRTIAELQARIRALAAALPAGAWIRAHGYDETALRERRHPTRAELDEAAPEHPVVLVHWSVHRCVLNSAALAALGIGAETPDPPGGWIVRDPQGLPLGPLYETATNAAQARSLAAYAERLAEHAPALFRANARAHLALGITALGDAYVGPPLLRLYQSAAAGGGLPLRVSAYCGGAAGLFAPPRACLTDPATWPEAGSGDGSFRLVGIKLFVDGGGNTTAASVAGQTAHPAPRPARVFYRQEELDALVAAAHARGLQVAVHAAGDIAVDMALTAMERARAAYPRLEPHFRVEHAVLLSDALIRRLAAVGAVVVTQPLAITYHAGHVARAPLAEGLRYLPLRDLLAAGVTVAASSDSPCYPLDPLRHVWAAVTRATLAGEVHAPEQRLTVEEALRLATVHAARAVGTADEEGSLAPGRRADLVVLSADPRTVPPDTLHALRVEAVYRAGALVFERTPGGAAPSVGRQYPTP
jgi:predicted amidohydrolase YtcJ